MKLKLTIIGMALAALVSAALLLPKGASAHCDTKDGPVVASAQEALDTGNLNPVLAWVADKDVPVVKAEFDRALKVRTLSPEAKEMADNYFFETVVRVHRAAEGAPYTGLKPAGTDLGPIVPKADEALKTGSVDALAGMVSDKVQEGIREQFNNVNSKKNYDKNDVAAGREYVEAYVKYMHYVEGIYDAAEHPGAGHQAEGAAETHDAAEIVSATQSGGGSPVVAVVESGSLDKVSTSANPGASAAGLPKTGGPNDEGGYIPWVLAAVVVMALGIVVDRYWARRSR